MSLALIVAICSFSGCNIVIALASASSRATEPKCLQTSTRSGSRNSVFKHDPDNAERGAAQRIRIFRAGRLFVDRPEANKRVDLVGERDGNRHRIGRHQIVRPFRLVVVLAGVRDRFILALRLARSSDPSGPCSSGNSPTTSVSKSALHSCAARSAFFRIGPHQGASSLRQSHDARDTLSLRAEFFVENDLLEFRQPVFQPRLQIRLVEELGVGQPRADDALIAGDDRLAAVARFLVCDENEFVDELCASADRAARNISGCCGWWRGSPHRGSTGKPGRTCPSSSPAIRPGPRLRQADPHLPPAHNLARKRDSSRRRRMMSARRAGSSTTLAASSLAT